MRPLFFALALLAVPGCGHAAAPSRSAPPRAAEEMRALLTELIAVDTSNPPGNETAAAEVAARWLREAGIESQLFEPVPGRAHLIARLKGTGGARPVLVLAHLDTVPARREEWASDPWVLTERDGFLYGRGVQDNKGMAAASVLALRRLTSDKVKLKRDVVLVLSADEEAGGKAGIDKLLEHHPELREAELAINEGGLTELSEDRSRVRFVNLQAAERVSRNVTLKATGPGGHSSVPPAAPNPMVRLAAAVARVGSLTFPTRLTPVTRLNVEGRVKVTGGELGEALKRLAASPDSPPQEAVDAIARLEPALAAVLRTTCVPTVFNAGTRPNVIPATAEATINCRLLPDEDIQAFRARLVEAVADKDIQVELNMTPPDSPASPVGDNAMFRAATAAAKKVWPGAPVFPRMSTGTTESTELRRAGIHAYGIDLFALTPDDARTAHAPNERIPSASLQPGAEFVYQLLSELAK
ncbi:acetylornithine deacetylase/succinyl-diaminopimelate desuccinylase-like protein [Archangium gephyra]|uniref:Acetylornithine deacetylase/succinyl-diaminopimelate desuccinylase-like protein n=2 Tax=Archangium gephyra TaxID=48 RepID=A0ABX9JQP7_9BACT|nr:M20/M25/M40 family metallo-hydrolase [Archangium gephyra]REG24559.1 acetylornithine deacetylase/succinyl-diaminopimelate desuccinylase-like protein [Archangium gephyra]